MKRQDRLEFIKYVFDTCETLEDVEKSLLTLGYQHMIRTIRGDIEFLARAGEIDYNKIKDSRMFS